MKRSKKIKYSDLWRQSRDDVGLRLGKLWLVFYLVFIGYGIHFRLGILAYVLNCYGLETNAVITGLPTHYGGAGSKVLHYTFDVNGRHYSGANAIDIPNLCVGDSIRVCYIKSNPKINMTDEAISIRTLSF